MPIWHLTRRRDWVCFNNGGRNGDRDWPVQTERRGGCILVSYFVLSFGRSVLASCTFASFVLICFVWFTPAAAWISIVNYAALFIFSSEPRRTYRIRISFTFVTVNWDFTCGLRTVYLFFWEFVRQVFRRWWLLASAMSEATTPTGDAPVFELDDRDAEPRTPMKRLGSTRKLAAFNSEFRFRIQPFTGSTIGLAGYLCRGIWFIIRMQCCVENLGLDFFTVYW